MNKRQLVEKVKEMPLFKRSIALVSEAERKIIEERMEAFADMFCKSVLSPAAIAAARARAQEKAAEKPADTKEDGNAR